MGPETSDNLEKLAKTSKEITKTSKNFVKCFAFFFFSAVLGSINQLMMYAWAMVDRPSQRQEGQMQARMLKEGDP